MIDLNEKHRKRKLHESIINDYKKDKHNENVFNIVLCIAAISLLSIVLTVTIG